MFGNRIFLLPKTENIENVAMFRKEHSCFVYQVSEFNNLTLELENWLRMRFHPVAVKMLKKDEKIPKDSIVPTRDWKHKYALCQAIARAQRYEETITMLKNDNWCFEPVIGLGLVLFPQSFENGTHRYPDSVRNLKAAAEWGRNMPRLPFGKYNRIYRESSIFKLKIIFNITIQK